jgi:hypothetical protein
MDVLSMVGTAVGTIQKLREVSDKIKNADMRSLLADLQMQVADIKIEAARLKQENSDLQQALKQEQERKATAKKLVHREGVLWLTSPEPGENPGPFCPNCSTPEKPIAVTDHRGTQWASMCKFRCAQCQGHF